ncbi:response regulator transcription factor [Glycomyces sp. TRM65418]|uniref:response regulator transcription factor n=1 Tax=Glycomyces sp. TRM65418 TaxID=2867006 RepID=UPI001CE6285C|nr:response regulator transcription factor [Glycomyces sp. TRM65418]MCC3764971.1 response regulator transcription factor [Glycomyces sp. TRM65418]QZD54607.1 response regulator transcription factor [Glycomyces sp. TRM65418]
MAQLLLIEDDERVRSALLRSLRDLNHQVASASDAMSGLRAAVDHRPDLVVLDLGLPDLDGSQMLRMLRGVSDVPVIVATARDDEDEIVRVLGSGADDYVVKPFTAKQLDARIQAVLRRVGGAGPTDATVAVGPLRIDPRGRSAHLDGAALELSPKEFDLLHYLAARVGEVVAKRRLLTDVWDLPFGGADKTVDVHLAWLRRKLGETAQAPRFLHTVRGVGVKLVDPTDGGER